VRDPCANHSKIAVTGRHRPGRKVLLKANFGVPDVVTKLPISAFGTLRPRVQISPSRQRGPDLGSVLGVGYSVSTLSTRSRAMEALPMTSSESIGIRL
jgi:hypothetical protein